MEQGNESPKNLQTDERSLEMSGLAKICKMFGRVKASQGGEAVTWVYDYAEGKPVLESEMTDERWKASEKAKWERVKKEIKP